MQNHPAHNDTKLKAPKKKKLIESSETSQAEEMVLLIKRQRQQRSSFSYLKCAIITLIVLILVGIFYFMLIKTGFFKASCLYVYNILMDLYKKYPKTTFFVIWLIEVVNLVLMLPLYSILTFIVCSIFENFFISYFYCLFCSLCGSGVVYFISQTKLKPCLLKRFDTNLLFTVLRKYSREKPWKTAFLTRFLFIAAGLKEYVLALIDNPFLAFIGSACCLHTMWILEVCFIHMEIGEISSFMDRGSTPWSKRSLTEKIYTIVVFVIIVFTVVFMGFLGYKAKQILKEEKEKVRNAKKLGVNRTFEAIV